LQKVNELRAAMIPVNGVILKILALQTSRKWQIESFSASNGWIYRFKDRYGLVLRKGTKRTPKLNAGVVDTLRRMMTEIYNICITNNVDYIINVDETPIVYDLVYDQTLANRGDLEVLISKVQNSKKRFTATLGIIKPMKQNIPQVFKCKPMLIFKGKSLRSLVDIYDTHKSDSSILLNFQEKAWNDEKLYTEFLKKCLPDSIANGNYKILLVHDNVSFHLSASVVNTAHQVFLMKPICLPPNSTAYAQPLDVSINKPIKSGMRQMMLEYLVRSYGGGQINISKNMLIEWLKTVWYGLPNDMIVRSFDVCGIGISPVDTEKKIYWLSLQSLQEQVAELQISLPSIREVCRNIFTDTHITDENHPQVFLFTPPSYLNQVTFNH